jgi:hypothetical protein
VPRARLNDRKSREAREINLLTVLMSVAGTV